MHVPGALQGQKNPLELELQTTVSYYLGIRNQSWLPQEQQSSEPLSHPSSPKCLSANRTSINSYEVEENGAGEKVQQVRAGTVPEEDRSSVVR